MTDPIPLEQARNLSALQLAFVGDAVYSLMVRTASLKDGTGLRSMHQKTTRGVNAAAQASALLELDAVLTEDEKEIVRRGRNAHPRHQAPKSATSAQYSASTGLEALIGYHYLTGQNARLRELFGILLASTQTKENK